MEQSQCESLFTAEFFTKHYVIDRRSYPSIRKMLAEQGVSVSVACIYNYAKKLGFGRSVSEGKRNLDPNPLDYSIPLLDDRSIQCLDGFLLGDGGIHVDDRSSVNVARLSCGLQYEEFCRYLMAPYAVYRPSIDQYADSSMSSGYRWQGRTKTHPDFYKQWRRWYVSGKKQPPDDVRLTPKSVMMWYLGDGSLVATESMIMARLSTDGFSPERVGFLVKRLNDLGIACHRNNNNRIQIDARGIPAFFDFIGKKSPVQCYSYKFEMPEWRFSAKRMKEVADDLDVDYHRLAYFVKIGRVPCFRASENGKPRFLPEHIDVVKKMILANEI